MTDHPEYWPLRPRHHEALIGQELRRLAAADGWLHPAGSVLRSAAGFHAAVACPRSSGSVPRGSDGVFTGP
jgi:hypothetical protein